MYNQSIYISRNKKSPLLTDFYYLCIDLEGNTYTTTILIPDHSLLDRIC
jgi:hypothetical protein